MSEYTITVDGRMIESMAQLLEVIAIYKEEGGENRYHTPEGVRDHYLFMLFAAALARDVLSRPENAAFTSALFALLNADCVTCRDRDECENGEIITDALAGKINGAVVDIDVTKPADETLH